jgi:membrane protein YdbS with pleckstrin-like domain
MLRDVARCRRATSRRADARPAPPAPSRQPARDPLLDARAGAGWALLVVAQAAWLVAAPADARWQVLALALTAVLAAAHLTVMPRWRYAVHRWEAAPDAVYTQSGWFDQERRIAPVSRIQTVDTERGPLEQLFGLSSVTVTTASAAGALEIKGLDREVADRLVDDLTATTVRDDEDAT